jgi:hypothetical protein
MAFIIVSWSISAQSDTESRLAIHKCVLVLGRQGDTQKKTHYGTGGAYTREIIFWIIVLLQHLWIRPFGRSNSKLFSKLQIFLTFDRGSEMGNQPIRRPPPTQANTNRT